MAKTSQNEGLTTEEEIDKRLGLTKNSHPGCSAQSQEARVADHLARGAALRKDRQHFRGVPLATSPAFSGKILALRAISNGALAGQGLPKRIKLLNWGVNNTVSKGPVKVGANTMSALSSNQEKMGFDSIALDYNHNSLPGHPNFQPDPRKVAGYGSLEVVAGDGLFLTALAYTPSGIENALEYRDLSPAVMLDDSGEVVFAHSVALCAQGEVNGLSFYSVDVADGHATPANALSADLDRMLCITPEMKIMAKRNHF